MQLDFLFGAAVQTITCTIRHLKSGMSLRIDHILSLGDCNFTSDGQFLDLAFVYFIADLAWYLQLFLISLFYGFFYLIIYML